MNAEDDALVRLVASAISPKLWSRSRSESSLTGVQLRELRAKSLARARAVVIALGLERSPLYVGTRYVTRPLSSPKAEADRLLERDADGGIVLPVNVVAVASGCGLECGHPWSFPGGECALVTVGDEGMELVRNARTTADPKLLIAYALGLILSEPDPAVIIWEREIEEDSWARSFALELLMPTELFTSALAAGEDVSEVFAVSRRLVDLKMDAEGLR